MATVSLPIYESRPAPPRSDIDAPVIDRSKPYPSCPWLEHGLAFNRRSLNACLIAHHDRGYPYLCDFNGGEVDVRVVMAAKTRIIRENQNGGHEACRGCPHLVVRRWRQPRYPVRLMGIAQFSHCNIECNYCYLQTKDPSEFSAGFDPYEVMGPIRSLARQGVLDPQLTADWGGGEPTIYPEFDAVLKFLTERGATTWVHTNGTRLPAPIRAGLSTKRIHILCSVDAGTREVWKLIKKRDLLGAVWRNLEQYIRSGCRVMLKYIMKEENCAEDELRIFVERAAAIGARELVLDIDYDFPDPSAAVIAGLRMLKRLATLRGIHTTFGSTGSLYTPEIDVAARLDRGRGSRTTERLELWTRDRLAYVSTQARLAARLLRRN